MCNEGQTVKIDFPEPVTPPTKEEIEDIKRFIEKRVEIMTRRLLAKHKPVDITRSDGN
jgi:hypothetical protein